MDDYEAWDELFHRTIVEAAGNPLLAGLYDVVNQARIEVVWTTLRRTMFEQETRIQFAKQHARIAESIAARNSNDAWAAMRDHMSTIADVYIAVENRQLAGPGSVM
jgi:DNA-binding FadR family transcriptional regulator